MTTESDLSLAILNFVSKWGKRPDYLVVPSLEGIVIETVAEFDDVPILIDPLRQDVVAVGK